MTRTRVRALLRALADIAISMALTGTAITFALTFDPETASADVSPAPSIVTPKTIAPGTTADAAPTASATPATSPTTRPTSSPSDPYILVPYEQPESADPHAADVTSDLETDLRQRSIAIKRIAPIEHLDAVTDASTLCAENGAAGLLVPQGRYEQTLKIVQIPFVGSVVSYPTHVEVRLDLIACSGTVAWSKATEMNEMRSALLFTPGNVGAIVDDSFRRAVAELTVDLTSALRAAMPQPSVLPQIDPIPSDTIGTAPYVLVPFGEPGIADPRSDDMTRSLAKALDARGLSVVAGKQIDHLAVVSDAAALCSRSGSNALIVPDVRLEQTVRTYADVRLTALACNGRIIAHARGTADLAATFGANRGATMVEATERAASEAIDRLVTVLAPPKR